MSRNVDLICGVKNIYGQKKDYVKQLVVGGEANRYLETDSKNVVEIY